MSAVPTLMPNSVAIFPSAAGTVRDSIGRTFGVPSSKWYPGAPETVPQKFPRWKASMYCVTPRSVPPEVKSIVLKIGDTSVFCATVRPLDNLVAGLNTVVPVDVTYDSLTGIRNTGIVVDEPVEGSVPTML